MRFITFGYLIFFLVVFALYWLSQKKKAKFWLLAIASSVFYASWSIPFFFHFSSFIWINYFFSLRIRNLENQFQRKALLTLALFLNFGNLIVFKYFYFILRILQDSTQQDFFTKEVWNTMLFNFFGQDSIVLPLAISFYTFQMSAYLIDVYYNKIQRKDSLLEFYIFVLFFPQLVAGPIMRHSDFFYQYDNPITLTKEKIIKGLFLIFIGLIKKVIIADNIAFVIEPIYSQPLEYNGLANFLAGVGYAIRLYGDFSGYTDIARGSAYLLGFTIPENFHGPFLSTSASEFWQRWHVTLSSWLRDYIYIPLGGNRISQFRTYLNLILTFTIGGIWHGANYTFLVWGFFYGILLSMERPFLNFYNSILKKFRILKVFGILYSFTFFAIGCLFFNAPDIRHSFWMFKQIFLFGEGKALSKDQYIQILTFLLLVFIFNFFQYYKKNFKIKIYRDIVLLYFLGLLVMWLLGNYSPQTQSFIYFQF
ncbi:MAG: MBOAT family O-acyltransferase [Leptonema sp. (in: bacteria)]